MNRAMLRIMVGLIACGIAVTGWAQTPGVGAAAFLRRGVDARAMGMGGAHLAVADGYSSIYWNPAGLARTRSAEVGGMTSNIYGADIFFNFLAGVVAWEFGESAPVEPEADPRPRPFRLAVGVSFTEMATEVRAYDDRGNPLGLIRYSEGLYGLGVGAWVSGLGYAGGVVKAYTFRAPRAGVDGGDATAFGIGFDVGIAVPVWGGLWLGLVAADIGDSRIQWRNTPTEPADKVSGRYAAGMAYTLRDLLLGEDRLVVALDATVEPLVATQTVRGGVEYSLLFLSLRAGAAWRREVPLSFTAGIGIRAMNLSIDGAWVQNRELEVEGAGHTLVLSAAFSF